MNADLELGSENRFVLVLAHHRNRKMAREIISRVLKSVVVLAFLCLNLAIASPVGARLRNTNCIDPEKGGTVNCCEFCLIVNCDCGVES